MRKPILIDVSLTGGRGPAKKALELTSDLALEGIPYQILTDKGFCTKLNDVGISPDYIINTNLGQSPTRIIKSFYKEIKEINFSFMVRLGARVPGPIAARKLGKPYIIADGGLPDYLSDKEDLYERKTFEKACKYLVTTQFNWKYPKRTGLDNIDVCGYPISIRSFNVIKKLKIKKKIEILKSASSNLKGQLPTSENSLLINLVMTGDYLNANNRVTYGAWLTTRQYDQCIGFIRRLFTDLGENTNENEFLFMDKEISRVVIDLQQKYKNISVITYKRNWDFTTELYMKAAADVTISRATNYQPYIAALERGCNITTPVPADGYMDEDSAALQYSGNGYTKLIPYDDEKYVFKLLEFVKNKEEQNRITKNLKNNNFLYEKNLNKIIVDYWKQISE
ncbi:hypothetical protein A2865_00685 [Candidatus Woesebacteria bacterium RIFCSPHIGHO2_01_FULL_39_17]|uniref:Glycosyl transferase family 1 domain-containing protein n=3 Tax=Candidatus Woeseibacteriota TaxID=1752722 RepID=A0A0G0RIK5_9BACT|nr:MAG: hypothetical protein US72_C0013G0017 [Microgenomates group bacterium GW2011_GWC1_38_12]KKQ93431.1 MAG: hypothetical protein UT19_C0012G0020 [Candidatus Woesebacteria bacterium GW2011_GWB1_39_10b]KKR13477.1 MAG: hypothetical protein UT40_C0016G0008 [Candidatus Woesebacteria bacterium GW2011_GWA1_39_21b]OGM22916.1 MAG: hypothetical protein A2865_00685 [Candidatus Woesebacteria bacterium RIFCSPHIGHO2_01_FULL_39_17]OGM65388.1 MAG: hypothetical protein A3A52_00570 [Candidatus Woesebacteria b